MATYSTDTDDVIRSSYRYLRLSILVVVAMLATSLVLERWVEGCRLGSVSAYYFSPVHSVFVGALVALGAVMIALKGADALEDLFLNVAGALAPIVAFVPTTRPDDLCDADDVMVDTNDFVTNNIPSLAVGLVLAIVIAAILAKRQSGADLGPGMVRKLPMPVVVTLAISAVLLAVGVGWYFLFEDSFRRRAHGTTAITMFVFIGLAVAINVGRPQRLWIRVFEKIGETPPRHITDPDSRAPIYATVYAAVLAMMAVGGPLTLLLAPSDEVFWLEVVEVLAFGAFWLTQTAEGWMRGLTHADLGTPTAASAGVGSDRR